MAVERITMTLDEELAAEVRAAARRAGVSVSSWLSNAAAAQLRHDLLGIALHKWEEENGPFTAEELAEAERILSQTPDSSHDAA